MGWVVWGDWRLTELTQIRGNPQPYLQTESEVDAYLASLKSEPLALVRAGQKARVR